MLFNDVILKLSGAGQQGAVFFNNQFLCRWVPPCLHNELTWNACSTDERKTTHMRAHHDLFKTVLNINVVIHKAIFECRWISWKTQKKTKPMEGKEQQQYAQGKMGFKWFQIFSNWSILSIMRVKGYVWRIYSNSSLSFYFIGTAPF